MRKIISIICLTVCTLMLPLLCCGCFKDEEIVNKLYEGKAHDGELQYHITFEIDGEQYVTTKLYYFDGILKSSINKELEFQIFPGFYLIEGYDFIPHIVYPIFNGNYFYFPEPYAEEKPIYYFGTKDQNVVLSMTALSRIVTDETRWESGRRYLFNTEVTVSCNNSLSLNGKRFIRIKSQLPYGWISFRPLNDEYAFEALFEFDIETEDGEIIEFRNGKQVSYYRGPQAVRNREIFTSDL